MAATVRKLAFEMGDLNPSEEDGSRAKIHVPAGTTDVIASCSVDMEQMIKKCSSLKEKEKTHGGGAL